MTKVHFIYLVGDNTPSFKLVHYLSMKSWLEANDEFVIQFWTNKEPTYSTWYLRLRCEYPNRIEVSNPYKIVKESLIDKMSCMTHKADYIRLKLLYISGGYYTDLDYICLKDFQWHTSDKPVYPVELDFEHHFEAIPNGLFYTPAGSSWIKDLMDLYDDYDPESWNKTSIQKPTELYFQNPDRIQVMPAGLFDPVTWRYEDWQRLFFSNVGFDFSESYGIHFSESITKDFLRYINLEHIMTVDTNFTRAVRHLVSKYWDFDKKQISISKYE